MLKINNPLLDVDSVGSLPAFSQIKSTHILEAVQQVIRENKDTVDKLCELKEVNAENVIRQLEQLDNRLDKVWSPVSHLNAVMNNDELRKVYTACLPLLSDYHTEMGQHKGLYTLIDSLRQSESESNTARSKVIDNLLKKFKLSGVDLDKERQAIFKEKNSQLLKTCSQFSDNVLDATNEWTKSIHHKQELSGLSNDALDMLQATAKQHNKKNWLITLDFPVMNAVMTYADDRGLRNEVYKASITRASDQAENITFDNCQAMESILELRTEKAALLGFDNYAKQSLYSKMADDPDQVLSFLNDLLEKSKPQAKKEIEHIKAFANKELAIDKIQAWDLAYVSEKIKNKELKYSEEDIKPWFSVDSVLAGLFELVNKLYGYSVKQNKDVDVWHKDVGFYEIYDLNKKHLASFYLDLYARQHKRGGAWMGSYCGRYHNKEGLQIPVAFLTCNSSPASAGKPALLTHSEVITLFHEFGHGLHHMLTQVDYLDVSGISGVEWDAVELPSQFMENWCWQRESLDMFAKHYETGELIPDGLYNKLLKTKNFNSSLGMLRQLEFSIFDMRLHMDINIHNYNQISSLLNDVREQTSLLPIAHFNRFQNSFSHVFAGGYAAGYYSYKWAEVLSADAFGKFEEAGLFDKETAESFLHEILEKGGSRAAKESFIAFRGRDPDISALLRHTGIEGVE